MTTAAVLYTLTAVLPSVAGNPYPAGPESYSVDDVTIRLSRVSAESETVIEIRGGQGFLRSADHGSDSTTVQFEVVPEEVIDLLNKFHQAYFLHSKDFYHFPQEVKLDDERAVKSYGFVGIHTPTTTITLEIADYTKSTKLQQKGPSGLMKLADQIESFVDTKTSQKHKPPGSASN